MSSTWFLLAASLLATGPILLVIWASRFPAKANWLDTGDCRGIISHTVRAMSAMERMNLWESRFAFQREHGSGYELIKAYSFRKKAAKSSKYPFFWREVK